MEGELKKNDHARRHKSFFSLRRRSFRDFVKTRTNNRNSNDSLCVLLYLKTLGKYFYNNNNVFVLGNIFFFNSILLNAVLIVWHFFWVPSKRSEMWKVDTVEFHHGHIP